MDDKTTAKSPRVIFLDILRVMACFMVIMVHSGEFFYIGPGDAVIREHSFWVNTYGSFLRSCVPLFVIISGYLILPMKESTSIFYKKRFTRIIYPLLIWSIIYAVVPFLTKQYGIQEMLSTLFKIPINFVSGHLWFVYMLIGLYLFIPVISPWFSTASRNSKLLFLTIWVVTLFVHFTRRIYPEILGECHWNEFHALYYFSGYIGYLVLGAFMKHDLKMKPRTSIIAGILLVVTGYIITNYGFAANIETAKDLPTLEVTWRFTTINVAMMSVGFFLVVKEIKISSLKINEIIGEMSNLSYGVYLAHILVLNQVYTIVHPLFSTEAITIPVVALTTFICTYILIKALSYLPKSKYLVG